MNCALTFDATGTARGLYTEVIDLHELGVLSIRRISLIEFDDGDQVWRVRTLQGETLFSDPYRQVCLNWEREHLLSP
jgi:hypothetical protein